MTVKVSVYAKNGLCPGKRIGNATFGWSFGVPWPPSVQVEPLVATPGGPLSGKEHVYDVKQAGDPEDPIYEWQLVVDAPAYQPWEFHVRNWDEHTVWLSPD